MATEVPWSVLRRAIDLSAVEDALGLDVTVVGEEDVCSCPLPSHPGADANPSFSIKNTTYAWFCFVCDRGGALWELIAEIQSTDYDGAIEWLRDYADELETTDNSKWLARIEKKLAPKEVEKVERNPVLPWFPQHKLDHWRGQLQDTDYFTDRGISESTQRLYRLGYDTDYTHTRWGNSEAVVIPHFFHDQLVGWQARTLEDKKPKYVASTDFPKKDTLFNWDLAVLSDMPVFVVESPMTVLHLFDQGFIGVATFGASISERQIELLTTIEVPLWLAYDNDDAGQKAVQKLSNALQPYVQCSVIPAPEGEKADLGDCTREQVKALIDSKRPSFLAVAEVN